MRWRENTVAWDLDNIVSKEHKSTHKLLIRIVGYGMWDYIKRFMTK